MTPDLELVQVRQDRSFKVWSHGYPYRTVRWHYHPEHELHLVTATTGNRYIGDHIGAFGVGDLVLVGSNVPHNWISDVAPGETVEERCLVLQFTDETICGCVNTFPELRFVERLMKDAARGLKFSDRLSRAHRAAHAQAARARPATQRIVLFLEIFDILNQDRECIQLASAHHRLDTSAADTSTRDQLGARLHRPPHHARTSAKATSPSRTRQSVSAFCRSFRKHTGLDLRSIRQCDAHRTGLSASDARRSQRSRRSAMRSASTMFRISTASFAC